MSHSVKDDKAISGSYMFLPLIPSCLLCDFTENSGSDITVPKYLLSSGEDKFCQGLGPQEKNEGESLT